MIDNGPQIQPGLPSARGSQRIGAYATRKQAKAAEKNDPLSAITTG